ncbi:MAG: glycosyltransferase, partial [Acidobacteria bacterium]|nr:glycosyltransferase [Acidobacteriota bacterium]
MAVSALVPGFQGPRVPPAPPVKVAFASGPGDLNQGLTKRMQALFPELPLYVVSEFPPECPEVRWIPYHVGRSFWENFARCRAVLENQTVRLSGVLLAPRAPHRRMRILALLLAPAGFLAYNENLDSFMLRPRCARAILRHAWWRIRGWLRYQLQPGGDLYTYLWRLSRPGQWRAPLLYGRALAAGALQGLLRQLECPPRRPEAPVAELPDGISVVIPSRGGRELLAAMLPAVERELGGLAAEITVVDNGSGDGSAEWLRARYPGISIDQNTEPLSFARAVNRGIRSARYRYVCLLNNDMQIEPGFFAALRRAFDQVPDLFCATAQIRFPPGRRREETGKAVFAPASPGDFPIRCEEPIPGEDLSYVFYGSGGCSLYSTGKLRRLGAMSEIYEPAYVEDLDLGFRAWQRGWPSVFVAGAAVEHRHRSTTSRYFSPGELAAAVEKNYIRFLQQAVAAPAVFRRLWRPAIGRLYGRALHRDRPTLDALAQAARWPAGSAGTAVALPEDQILALASGDVAVFPGRAAGGRSTVLVASPYLPYPLSHGGAVRIYNLLSRAAAHFQQVLICFTGHLDTPPAELLDICAEIVLVRRNGTHSLPSNGRPDVVEEFDSPAFRAALRQTVRKWRPAIAQLEFTQMAQYARDCAPAKTILVEHDITCDLFEQLARRHPDWDTLRQLERWRRFETGAWRQVDRVAVMSERDRRSAAGARAFVVPNGVDLERFRPSALEPDPRQLLFVGSFAHLPNLLGLAWFLEKVWPGLAPAPPRLRVVAGERHQYYLSRHAGFVKLPLPCA